MKVKERYGKSTFEVLDVKESLVTTYILIFKDGEWRWEDIDNYVPFEWGLY